MLRFGDASWKAAGGAGLSLPRRDRSPQLLVGGEDTIFVIEIAPDTLASERSDDDALKHVTLYKEVIVNEPRRQAGDELQTLVWPGQAVIGEHRGDEGLVVFVRAPCSSLDVRPLWILLCRFLPWLFPHPLGSHQTNSRKASLRS